MDMACATDNRYRNASRIGFLFALLTVPLGSGGSLAQIFSIAENSRLTFGTLQIPASGNETFRIFSNTGATTGTGTLLYGSPARAAYTIACVSSCAGSWTATISIANVTSGNGSVVLGNFRGTLPGYTDAVPPFSVSSASFPITLYLGLQIAYSATVPAGPVAPAFDLVVTSP
jgi:hypothetical protein